MVEEKQVEKYSDGHIITLHEAMAMLHASYSTVLRIAASGELPAFRIRNS